MPISQPTEPSVHFPLAVFSSELDGKYLACPYELRADETITLGLSDQNPAVGVVEAVPLDEEHLPSKVFLITPSKVGNRAIISANMQYCMNAPQEVTVRPNFPDRAEEQVALAGIRFRMFDHETTEQELMAAHEQRISRYPNLFSAGFDVEVVKDFYQRLLYYTPRY